MELDTAYISNIEFLKPSSKVYTFVTFLLVVIHAVVASYLFSTAGEPYRLVVEELILEAAKNGTVLTIESLQSTDDQPLPGEFAPSPIAIVLAMVSVGLHALFLLIQRWSVRVRIWMQFTRVSGVRNNPSSVCVYPPEYRGKPEIVDLVKSSEELQTYYFTFQRRKFQLTPSSVQLLSFPIERKIVSFVSDDSGIIDIKELKKRENLYGRNAVDIPVPPFWKLYVEQLLSPIPIFQLFCSALWMMDEYWKYTLFTLFSIFGFEVSTTVQRKRSLETLRSMSIKSVLQVEAMRMGSWVKLSSDELVPGDRLRLLAGEKVGTVPCDSLIIRGSAVVNEASLTGESVPQMKDAIDDDREEILDVSGRDRIHCLFSGTSIIRADSDMELIALRTGSQSSQGELLRMVEFSQQAVSGDKKDTMYLLFLLLVFAIMAASYVVYERLTGTGSENLTRMKSHKLMLRVIMIITSVVPPELPMQLSLSVNTALIALNKIGILCTEPFRVPTAGTVSRCFFDKTGTITSDQLRCHGFLSFPSQALDMARVELVVAGCHSLVAGGDGKLMGDPVEVTAIEYIAASYNPLTSTAVTKDSQKQIKILHRFHFSSALQRMSCVVSPDRNRAVAVVKGSPEVILSKLRNSDSVRSEYLQAYEELAHRGMRVLALAMKELPGGPNQHYHREAIECDLEFVGFASFACETRADSKTVIAALSGAAELPCIMVTGDAALTSIHVAKQVGICRQTDGESILRLTRGTDSGSQLVWESVSGNPRRKIPFVVSEIEKLSKSFDLTISGDLLPDDESHPIWGDSLNHICVFARMSPQQKEKVISKIRSLGGKPLMCGDGGNDVGALKQADVGVALLAGFGSANTGGVVGDAEDDAEEELEKQGRFQQLKEKHLSAKMKAEFAVKKKELMEKQQGWLQLELAKPGNGGYWNCIKIVTARMREDMNVEAKKLQLKYGVGAAWSSSSDKNSNADKPAMIQMGDASVAAPFTSRAPSIRSVIQIIRQGRCTLLVAVQMMQIMMLESLISAYTFAAITMEGGRATEIQMIGSSVFVMVASIAFTYAKPAKKLSNVIPVKSVFHPSIFFSVVLQVLIHLGVLVSAMNWAKAEMGDHALTELYNFERERDEKLTKIMAKNDANDEWGFGSLLGGGDILSMFKSVPYQPNLLNTVMFLVKTAQQVSVLVVNYKGSPWMQGALENRALFLSMFACALGIIICSTGYIPWLNNTLELLVLPNELRQKVLILLGLSTVGSLVADRLIVLIFAQKIFFASTVKPLMETRLNDFLPILKLCGFMVIGVAALPLVVGNPIALIGAVYAYRQYKKWQEDKELAELKTKVPELFA
jgi:cation-transporting ATPase 13A1